MTAITSAKSGYHSARPAEARLSGSQNSTDNRVSRPTKGGERQTDRHRQRDIDTERERQRETETHRERQRERARERQRDRDRQTETDKDRERQAQTDRQTDRELRSVTHLQQDRIKQMVTVVLIAK